MSAVSALLPTLNHTRRCPPFLRPEIRARLVGRTFTVAMPRPITLRLRRPERIGVAEWASRYRMVTDGAHPGPWRNEYAPHTVPIMEAFGQPWVREVWFCGVEQSGKTNTMLNCLGWIIDCDPGNVFYLMPTEDTASKVTGGKIRPMLERSPRLKRYLSPRSDDTTLARINLAHGMSILPAWANSPSAMATWAAKHCMGDEVDKYPAMAGKEADPITLIKKRNRTYRGRYKRFFSSTPAGLFIYKGTYACDKVFVYNCRCPHCQELIRIDTDHLTADGSVIGYACNACGVVWNDHDRELAIRGGAWVCIKGEDNARPATVGFHHRAWECLDISLAEIHAAWLKAQDGDHSAKVAWANGYEAMDYIEEVGAAPELDHLADRAENYAPMVPMAAALLTAGVDVQADRLEVEVVAWGVGAESWGIDYAVLYGDTSLIDVWAQLDRYLMQRWAHESGEQLGLARTFIDSGYRTVQVYKFCAPRKGRGVYAIKGASSPKAPEIQGPNWQRFGSLRAQVFNLGGNRLKSQMFGYLGIQQPGHGFCHLPDTYRPEWFAQLLAEHIVTRKIGTETVEVWDKKQSGARNEAIDLRVYALAAMLSLRVDIKGLVAMLRDKAVKEAEKVAPAAPRKKGFVTGWKG